jgi:predicted kinase
MPVCFKLAFQFFIAVNAGKQSLELVVFYGVAGAGKSTLAKQVCARRHWLLIDSDNVARAFHEHDVAVQKCFTSVFDVLDALVCANRHHPGTIVFTDSVSKSEDYQKLMLLKKHYQTKMRLVRIVCDIDVALQRIKSRDGCYIAHNERPDLVAMDDFHRNNIVPDQEIENTVEGSISNLSELL